MKKTLAIIMVGMFVIVGCGSAVMGDDDDPTGTNRPPKAPVLIEEKSDWTKESYTYVFYSEDPDGDQVYYDIAWEEIGDTEIVSSPDDPVVPWLGPFESGEELEKTHTFDQVGEYELRAYVCQSMSSLLMKRGRYLEAYAIMHAGIIGVKDPNISQRILKILMDIPFRFLP